MYYFWRVHYTTFTIMEINQFLGFLVFLTIFTMGFWMLIFLLTFVVPYWLFGNLMENFKLKKEAKKAKG
jgi:hypothetical protein